MLSLGPLAFASPWLLLLLLLLPLLWWLLKATPPKARRIRFPALRLLLGLRPKEQVPDRTPWWLLALRLLLVTLVILALARPLLNPDSEIGAAQGPVILVVDNGWSSARQWPKRQALLTRLLIQADRQNRPVLLLPTAPDPRTPQGPPLDLQRPENLRANLGGLQPRPWPSDYEKLTQRLANFTPPIRGDVIWLSDGLAATGLEDENPAPSASDAARSAVQAAQQTARAKAQGRALLAQLQRLGPLTVHLDPEAERARLLLPLQADGLDLRAALLRPGAQGRETVFLRAFDDEQRLLQRIPLIFEDGETLASADLALPLELRNRIARLSVEAEESAGTSLLVDERWRRRPVGLAGGAGDQEIQPLLSDLYYLERALSPFTEVAKAPLETLLTKDLAIIALPDLGPIAETSKPALTQWIEAGGLLLRFAGARSAAAAPDLLPVRLRQGSRALGGAMTWDRPARLAAFPENSPFFGLPVPADVFVSRQVLAEPSLDLAGKTWARLDDGTPLITAEQRGKGWLVLVHTSANTDWSNLSLSGLFVELLQKLVLLSQGVESGGGTGDALLQPRQSLDAFGRLRPPARTVQAIKESDLAAGRLTPDHPPGLYGPPDRRRALNLSDRVTTLPLLDPLPGNVALAGYEPREEQALIGGLLSAALLLALLDQLASLWLRGLLLPDRRTGKAVLAVFLPSLLAALSGATPAAAQQPTLLDDRAALASARETRLAYVRTGVPALDRLSQDGLAGLSRVLTLRTAVEPAAPKGVTLGRDELAFYPLLYWPISPEQADLDRAARRDLNRYLDRGGLLVIDLRDPSSEANFFGQASLGQQALRRLSEGLAIPPLAPLPPDHVLTKTFYLLQEFPGRYAGQTLWAEQPAETDNDGVSSVIITANDLAAAWAMDDLARPLYAVVPGGEPQREQAYRVGVNLTMYALTGNYKADQVHVPFILERLGQ